jgi:hypothetical protein
VRYLLFSAQGKAANLREKMQTQLEESIQSAFMGAKWEDLETA